MIKTKTTKLAYAVLVNELVYFNEKTCEILFEFFIENFSNFFKI